MNKLIKFIKVPSILSLMAPTALYATPVDTPPGYITFMTGGWTTASSKVQISSNFTNPQACPYTDGYVVDPADSGRDLFNSMLLTALAGHMRLYLTIDGCSNGRPHVIGVNILAQ